MQAVSFFLLLAAAALLQIAGASAWGEFARAFDLVLVAVVFFARRGAVPAATVAGAAGGLVADALAGGPLGLRGFADTLVGYTAARVAQQLVVERSSGVVLVFTLASALQQALVAALAFVVLPTPLPGGAAWAVARAVSTGLLGLLLARAERGAALWTAARRQRRAAGGRR